MADLSWLAKLRDDSTSSKSATPALRSPASQPADTAQRGAGHATSPMDTLWLGSGQGLDSRVGHGSVFGATVPAESPSSELRSPGGMPAPAGSSPAQLPTLGPSAATPPTQAAVAKQQAPHATPKDIGSPQQAPQQQPAAVPFAMPPQSVPPGYGLVPMVVQGPDGQPQLVYCLQPQQQQQQQHQPQQPSQQQQQWMPTSPHQASMPHGAHAMPTSPYGAMPQPGVPLQVPQHLFAGGGGVSSAHSNPPPPVYPGFGAMNPAAVQQQPDNGPKQLIVNFLDLEVTNADLHAAFSVFGPLDAARVIYDKATARSKGYGFVYYRRSADAATALHSMTGQHMRGRRIKVSYANPQRPMPSAMPGGPH